MVTGIDLESVDLVYECDVLFAGKPKSVHEQGGRIGSHEAVLRQVLDVLFRLVPTLVVARQLLYSHRADSFAFINDAIDRSFRAKVEELPEVVIPVGWRGDMGERRKLSGQ